MLEPRNHKHTIKQIMISHCKREDGELFVSLSTKETHERHCVKGHNHIGNIM